MRNKNYVLTSQQNVGNAERIISMVVGAWLFSRAYHGNNKLFKALLGGALVYRGAKGFCPLYNAIGVNTAANPKSVLVETDVAVKQPREEVYEYWRRLENLPLFMKHLESVRELSDTHSVWKAKIPGGLGNVEWKCEITSDVPGESIKWKSMPESQVDNTGLVRFMDLGEDGTLIRVNISYQAPAGSLGAEVAKLFTLALEKIIREDIKNFKRVVETK